MMSSCHEFLKIRQSETLHQLGCTMQLCYTLQGCSYCNLVLAHWEVAT